MTPHPFDPLSASEIESTIAIVRALHADAQFHVVSAQEPRKAQLTQWVTDASSPYPPRIAEVVAITTSKVFEGLVDLASANIIKWEHREGVQPIITLEELVAVERGCRVDPGVIKQCQLSGIAAEDMHKVYCDPWTIGHDARFGSERRFQQALMYYRPQMDNCQYQYPLDFCPVWDSLAKRVVAIDVPSVRRPLNNSPPLDYHHISLANRGGYRKDLRPISITQPAGVSFSVEKRWLSWQNWRFHIGFNYREGIVLHDVTFNDGGKSRSIFYRISLAEMVVPYGNPDHPHQRKHAFDLGEYGAGYMANSLSLGCDCKGAIHYLDAHLPTQNGGIRTIKNAVCIHEEDNGILFKHTDFRDDSTTVTRARKLVVQQVFTAANYEYAVQWIFHQDGTIQPEIRLTGILNTYAINADESTNGWGTRVHKGVNAHNHQHLFCLRIHPNIDGALNTVYMVDAMPSDAPVGSQDNLFGNAFYPKRTRFETIEQAMTDYNGATSRTWDIVNENVINPQSGKHVSYKLVSREVPSLLPKEGSLVWKRAAFARHAIHVIPHADDQLWPAGDHVPQTSGDAACGIAEWIGDGDKSIANTDIVLFHTFGLTHFPAPEDFPIMPAEPVSLLLRPRHFFECNPAMDVPPSYSITPSEKARNINGFSHGDCDDSKEVNGVIASP